MRGQIRKRGRNSWAVIVYLGRDPRTGKERRKWFSHKTRRDAERALRQVLNQLDAGGSIPDAKTLLGDDLRTWLRGHAGSIAPTTLASYRDTIAKHLAPALGYIPLTRLAPQVIREYATKKLEGGLSPTTVRYHLMVLGGLSARL